jgi:hypothetical protein
MTAIAAKIRSLEIEVADLKRQLEDRRDLGSLDCAAFAELIAEWSRARRAARLEQQKETTK